jgi:hypothetical protein
MRQALPQRLPGAGRLVALEAPAPPSVHVPGGIDTAHALRGDTARGAAARCSERAQNLTGQPLMRPDHETSPVAMERSEQRTGTQVAIGTPEIIRCGRRQKCFAQRTLLRMAICARPHVGAHATRGRGHDQGLAGQRRGVPRTQGPAAARARLDTVAIDACDPGPCQPRRPLPTNVLEEGGALRGAIPDQR